MKSIEVNNFVYCSANIERDKYGDIDWHINVWTKEIFVAQLLFVKFGNSQMTLFLRQNNRAIQAEKECHPLRSTHSAYICIPQNVG